VDKLTGKAELRFYINGVNKPVNMICKHPSNFISL